MFAAGSVPHCICTSPRTNSFAAIGIPGAATASRRNYTTRARAPGQAPGPRIGRPAVVPRGPLSYLFLSRSPNVTRFPVLNPRSTAVVIVNYRTPALVVDCLRSLIPEVATEPDLRVVVVDNASGDDSVAVIGDAIRREGWTWATPAAARPQRRVRVRE